MSRTLMATSSPSVAERRVDDGREPDPQADPAPGMRPGESLKHIELLASGHKSLTPLERCRALVSGRFSKFPKAEVRRVYEATGLSDDWMPEMPRAATG